MSYSAADLFSGAGGLTLGLKRAGFKVDAAIEIDSVAVKTYKTNHPDVEIFETDIREISTSDFLEYSDIEKNKLDLLAGCPPCEGFSTIRTLNGAKEVKDPRNNLVYQFLRFVKKLNPKTLMMENVPALAESERLGEIRDELKNLGFDTKVSVKNVSQFGVPQRRKRMIMLGSRMGEITFAKGSDCKKTVRETIGDLPKAGNSGDELHDIPENRTERVRELIKNIPIDGGSRTDLPENEQLECHKETTGFKDVYGRMAWDEVAPTITGGCVNPSKGRFLHPKENRSITLREAALLQSFPLDYYISLDRGKMKAAELIGDALPPKFVKAQAKKINKHLRGT